MAFEASRENRCVFDAERGMQLRQIDARLHDVVFELTSPNGSLVFIAYMDPLFPGYREAGILTWIVYGSGHCFSNDKEFGVDDVIVEALTAWKGLYGMGNCNSVIVNFR